MRDFGYTHFEVIIGIGFRSTNDRSHKVVSCPHIIESEAQRIGCRIGVNLKPSRRTTYGDRPSLLRACRRIHVCIGTTRRDRPEDRISVIIIRQIDIERRKPNLDISRVHNQAIQDIVHRVSFRPILLTATTVIHELLRCNIIPVCLQTHRVPRNIFAEGHHNITELLTRTFKTLLKPFIMTARHTPFGFYRTYHIEHTFSGTG